MKRFSILLIIVLLTHVITVSAQDAESRPPITVENVAQLTEITTIEVGGEPGEYALNPDGTKVAFASQAGLRVFDTESGTASDYLITESVTHPIFNSDGTLLVAHTVGSASSKIYVVNLDPSANEQVSSWDVTGLIGANVIFSPDSSHLIYAASEVKSVSDAFVQGYHIGPSIVHITNISTQEDDQTFTEPNAILGRIFINADGSRLVYTSTEWLGPDAPTPDRAKLRIIQTESGEAVETPEINGIMMGLGSEGQLGFVSFYDSLSGWVSSLESAAIINLDTGEAVMTLTAGQIWDLAFNLDSTLVAVSQSDLGSLVSIRQTDSGSELAQLTIEDAEAVFLPTFSSDGTVLAAEFTSNGETFVRIWGVIPNSAETSATTTPDKSTAGITIQGTIYVFPDVPMPDTAVIKLLDPNKTPDDPEQVIESQPPDSAGGFVFTNLPRAEYMVGLEWLLSQENLSAVGTDRTFDCQISMTILNDWLVFTTTDSSGQIYLYASQSLDLTEGEGTYTLNDLVICP